MLIVRIITILASPLMTRYYGKDAFGVLAMLQAHVSLLATVCSLSLPLAVTYAKNDAKLKLILDAVIKIQIYLLPLTAILGIFLYAEDNKAVFLIILFPVLVATSVLSEVFSNLLMKFNSSECVAQTSLRVATVGTVAKIIGGFYYSSPLFFVLISAFSGPAVGFLSIIKNRKGMAIIRKIKLNPISLLRLKRIWRIDKDLFLGRYPQTIIAMVFSTAPLILIAKYGTVGQAGTYAVAYMVVEGVASIIAGSLYGLMLSSFIENDNYKLRYDVIIKYSLLVLIPAGVLYLLIMLYGQELFGFVYGEEFSESSMWVLICAPVIVASHLIKPHLLIFGMKKTQEKMLYVDIGFSVLIGMFVYFLQKQELSLINTMVTYSIIQVFRYIFFLFFSMIEGMGKSNAG